METRHIFFILAAVAGLYLGYKYLPNLPIVAENIQKVTNSLPPPPSLPILSREYPVSKIQVRKDLQRGVTNLYLTLRSGRNYKVTFAKEATIEAADKLLYNLNNEWKSPKVVFKGYNQEGYWVVDLYVNGPGGSRIKVNDWLAKSNLVWESKDGKKGR